VTRQEHISPWVKIIEEMTGAFSAFAYGGRNRSVNFAPLSNPAGAGR
jgi:hypothetical protein